MASSTEETPLACDAAYVETCRQAAWAGRPMAETDKFWDPVARTYNFPDGWPDGVDADEYVRAALDRPPLPSMPVADENLSPSVRRLREMLR